MADRAAHLGGLVEALRQAIAATPSGAASLAWAEIADEQLAAHAWVERVAGDTLEIAVDSPAWAHALQLRAPELLDSLRGRARLGESVCRIRFRAARPADDGLLPSPAGAPDGVARGGSVPAVGPRAVGPRADGLQAGNIEAGGPRADCPSSGEAPAMLSPEAIRELSEVIARAGDDRIARALLDLLRASAAAASPGAEPL